LNFLSKRDKKREEKGRKGKIGEDKIESEISFALK
jgi:hypothetical protein